MVPAQECVLSWIGCGKGRKLGEMYARKVMHEPVVEEEFPQGNERQLSVFRLTVHDFERWSKERRDIGLRKDGQSRQYLIQMQSVWGTSKRFLYCFEYGTF